MALLALLVGEARVATLPAAAAECPGVVLKLAVGGPNAELEAKLTREINLSRKLAYVYWTLILSIAFIGVTKPF